MPCIIALIVFGILGIFSTSQRALAKEALSCVSKRVTLRPCDTGFQEKIKGKLLAKVVARSTFLAKVLNKYYEIFSWVFFILMIGSTVWVFRGVYNFYVYGSCNGLNSSGFCAFDPSGSNNAVTSVGTGATCGITKDAVKTVTLDNVDLSTFPKIENNSKDSVVFIGCYACDYSREAYPEVEKLIKKKDANFIFAHYPAKGSITDDLAKASYCVAKDYKDKFWDWNNYLFTENKDYVLNKANLNAMLSKFNFDVNKINNCARSTETNKAVGNSVQELNKTGIYGTPTIFINDKAFVGPKPYRVYRSAINKFIFF